jgi:hypothetical protein
MNESEPLMKCRENEHLIKTIGLLLPEDKYSGNLFTGCVVSVIKGA